MRKNALKVLVLLTVIFGGLTGGMGSSGVLRAETPSETPLYKSTLILITGGSEIKMKPGEVKVITVQAQNSGSESWKNDGPKFISIFTYEPKYRKSEFDPGTWLASDQVKRLIEPMVAPGEVGSFQFELRAPTTPGMYREGFRLASEATAWLVGGEFTLNIRVAESFGSAIGTEANTVAGRATEATVGNLTRKPVVKIISRSAEKIKVVAGKTISFTVLVENAGTNDWKSFGVEAPQFLIASGAKNRYSHKSWDGSLAYLEKKVIKPGEQATAQFFFTAPTNNGLQTAKFYLQANGERAETGEILIPVEVTGGAGEALTAPLEVELPLVVTLMAEPMIRVGILTVDEETDNEVIVSSAESGFRLVEEGGRELGNFKIGDRVRTAYVEGRYEYSGPGVAGVATRPVRYEPTVAGAVMTVMNFDRRVTREAEFEDSRFINNLEIRANSSNDTVWLINELPIEDYLGGLAETSNLSRTEFQKALMTAARTYAYYHYEHLTRHRESGFHVDAYRDQVYLGYGQAERNPMIVAGVEATRGEIVTYGQETAVTAYFSRSNGRTRDWSEVWNGVVPYSVSVVVPCDEGKVMWGHGVGMSASGAICLAKEGKSYEEILKYFYTGVEIERKW
mgnify:FL=1